MKFIPYGRQVIDDEDISAVVEVLRGDWITTGPKIKEFEDVVCNYIGCKYGVAVNSGTSALDIALASLDIENNYEVITTPFTFVATSNAILYNNLVPVFADIKPDTFNINPDEIRKKITDKTRAIIYMDYAGNPCDIDEIREIADHHELYLIEDACHALGAEYKGRKVGSFADVTVFSFHPVKLITTGEGGMAVTNITDLSEKMKSLRNHGIDREARERFGPEAGYGYDMKMLGRNYRMTDFQAALGISQLKKLDKFIKKRRALVKIYDETFKTFAKITLPVIKPHRKSAHHLYTLLLGPSISRDKFFNRMRELNIGVNVHYIPVYKHSYYQNLLQNSPKEYPIAEDVFNRIITLPLHQNMTDEDLNYVINSVESIIKSMDTK